MIAINLRFLGAILFLVIVGLNVKGKEWRGLVPLKSTKADVERLLGKPNQVGRYDIGNERVSILYSNGPCESTHPTPEKADCECLVRKDSVLRISVTLDSPVKVSQLGVDKTKYERTVVYAYRPTATYADLSIGVVYTIRESDDTVMHIEYLRSAIDCEEVIKSQTPTTPPNVWQGIVPLRSIRSDVERLLGASTNSSEDISIYDTAENKVHVSYAADPCNLAKRTPRSTADVVLKVTVSPRKTLLVQSLGLDKAKYTRIQNTHPENWIHYLNSAEGITVDATIDNGSEEVISIVYQPTARDRELRCGINQKVKSQRAMKATTVNFLYDECGYSQPVYPLRVFGKCRA